MPVPAAHILPAQEAERIGQGLAESAYLRERLQPSLRDVNALYFADLLEITRRWAGKVNGDLFDYGCGGSPYRSLFDHCPRYVRADVTPGPGIDRLLPADGSTSEMPDSYDVVFSSQVLEHVKTPSNYVAECRRILKTDGWLILTTHGMWEEHGCPYDFQRWTSRGLEELVESSGFTVVESCKVTTGARAACVLMHQSIAHFRCDKPSWLRYPLALWRRLHRWTGVPMLNFLGRAFPAQSIVSGATDSASLYLGVAILARKT